MRAPSRLIGPRHPLPARLVIQLGDEATALVAVELHDDVDDHAEQPLDLVHAQAPAGAALADHERHLLEGEGAAAGVDAGDAAGVAGRCEPYEREALVAAHLGQEDPVRLHAQARLEQRLGGDFGRALRILAVEQMHDVRMMRQRELRRVLDRDQALVARHLFDQALHEGRLARAGLAADDDGLVSAHRQAQEVGVAAGFLEGDEFSLERSQCVGRREPTADVRWNKPSRSKSSSRLTRSKGLRIVIETVPRITAGGIATWIRSPLGRVAERRGRSWLTC